MKQLLFLIFIIYSYNSNATNYYVASNGDDANSGTSVSSPWKSLNKLNAYFGSLKPGDNIYLNRGDIFYGNIVIGKSGNSGAPITIGAYGNGANPVVTGFTNVDAWTNVGNNVWESTSAVSTLNGCNMVIINNINTPMGRYPNSGFIPFQSHTSVSITSGSLTGSPNFTNGTVVIKTSRYTLESKKITSQYGGTLNYGSAFNYAPNDGWGFFIQNDSLTLDQQNEWWYSSYTKKIRIYSTSTPTNVNVCTIDTLVKGNNNSYLVFTNVDFTGANFSLLQLDHAASNTVQYCNLSFSGNDAVNTYASSFLNVNHCNISNISNHSIYAGGYNVYGDHAYIGFNTITNNGIIPGASFGQGNYAIRAEGRTSTIEYNTIDSVGYIGIFFDGDSSIVQNNFVNHFCMLLDDGGGIYTWNYPGNPPVYRGRKVQNNIVLNGVGNSAGTNSPTNFYAEGIYMDDGSEGVEISGNTVANCANQGVFIHNSHDIYLHDNTFYNNRQQISFQQDYDQSRIQNNKIKNNIFFSKTPAQLAFYYGNNIAFPISSLGVSDSNYFARPVDDSLTFKAGNNYTLNGWKKYSGLDIHSNKSPLIVSDINQLYFEYNATGSTKTISLNANYIDVANKLYQGTINLAPFTSVILIKTGAIINKPPVVNAGPDQIISLPDNKVKLSGTGADADGVITSYKWTQVTGPNAVTINNSNSDSTTVEGLIKGVYQFELKVKDNSGAFGADTMQVTVNSIVNKPPVANAGPDQTVTSPVNTIKLNGSANDSDGTIVSYKWSKISGAENYNILYEDSSASDVTGLVAGIYQFQLKAVDNNGASATDTVQVTVKDATNIAPSADAGPNQSITLPIDSIVVLGTGNDSDGIIIAYKWTKISGPSSFEIKNSDSAKTLITSLSEGMYQFELQVTDNNGAIGKDIIAVTVIGETNIPPTANAGSDQSITLPINSVTLSGSGDDVDGIVTSYKWSQIAGPGSCNIVNSNSSTTLVSGFLEGLYLFTLTVTDDSGDSGIDTVQIKVNKMVNKVPVANAGMNQIITLPIDSVILSGSGVEADGKIISYLWTKTSGPSSFKIANSDSARTSVTGLVHGLYQFNFLVTDDSGNTAEDFLEIRVNQVGNQPPVANAGSDQTIILPVNSVLLSGTGSDADGKVIKYLWTKISGPTTYNFANADSPRTQLNNLVNGVYAFELKVTDDKGDFGKDTILVTVKAPINIPPTANAGMDQNITLPTNTITLSGIGKDSDGTITNYKWSKISGPSSFNILRVDAAFTSVTGLVKGVYKFELTVTDNNGSTAADVVQINVNSPANISPLANAGSDQTIVLPVGSITLSGSGTDADGTIVSYAWTKISGPSTFNIEKSAAAITKVTNLAQGVYQFELKVTDNDGAIGTDIVQVAVKPEVNILPVADAGRDQTITLPVNSVTLSGKATDADGTIVSYKWIIVSGPSAGTIINNTSPITTVNNLIQGVYNFQLQVIDNKGGIGRDTVQITVKNEINLPPLAKAGPDIAISLPANSITLTGIGIDPDGTISSYKWTMIAGPSSFNIVNSSSPITDVSGLIEGVYFFELKVLDNKGLAGRDTLRVTVSSQNKLPVANAGSDLTVTLPTNTVKLTGSGTSANGPIINYAWKQISGPGIAIVNSPSSSTTEVANLVGGNYAFQLVVKDNKGLIGTDTVQIVVAEPRLNLNNQSNAIEIYPNPVIDITTLQINTLKLYNKISIIITDIKGGAVFRTDIHQQQANFTKELNLARLASGIYQLVIFYDGVERQTLNFVKF